MRRFNACNIQSSHWFPNHSKVIRVHHIGHLLFNIQKFYKDSSRPLLDIYRPLQTVSCWLPMVPTSQCRGIWENHRRCRGRYPRCGRFQLATPSSHCWTWQQKPGTGLIERNDEQQRICYRPRALHQWSVDWWKRPQVAWSKKSLLSCDWMLEL